MMSREAIAGTMDKLHIPALTYRGHCISGTATPSANDATLSFVLCMKEDLPSYIVTIGLKANEFVHEQ